jgi:hypothetical protein
MEYGYTQKLLHEAGVKGPKVMVQDPVIIPFFMASPTKWHLSNTP